jgi:sugar-phosphatase
VREFLPDADHAAENRELERREIADLEGVVALPGARRLLEGLPADRWTIVTSATRPLAEVRLRAAGLPIPRYMVTAGDVNAGKPNPEPYLKAASVLKLPIRDCIAIEDVPAGIAAGKAAGARVIAFTTTVAGEALHASGADWVLKDCSQIEVSSGDGLTLRLSGFAGG